MRFHTAWTSLTIAGLFLPLQAQWLNYPTPGVPRTKDGKSNLSAPAPRSKSGKPDLSGIWEAEAAPREQLLRFLPDGVNLLGEDPPSKYFVNILSDFKPEESPLRLSLIPVFQQRAAGAGKEAPPARCLPFGVPWADLAPAPFKIIQTPNIVVVIYEGDSSVRQIYTDGRKLPVDPTPSWMGYSTGKWEGDTLVVESIGFNDKSWLDALGHPHSEAMQVTERFHRRDVGHMDVQITIDDPKSYSKPFTIKYNDHLLPDTDVLEYFCAENEKDVKHITGSQ